MPGRHKRDAIIVSGPRVCVCVYWKIDVHVAPAIEDERWLMSSMVKFSHSPSFAATKRLD